MNPVHRRSSRAITLCAAILASHALFVSRPMSATSESTCEQLRSWARAYEQAPPTFDEFTTFDRAHRRAIFNAIPAAAKSGVAQEHLRRFGQRSDLSETQRALVAEAITLLTPAFYQRHPTAKKAARELWSRADKAFASQELRRAWFDLGSGSKTTRFSTPAASNQKQRPARPDASFCQCRYDDECFHDEFCGPSACTAWVGCGWGFDEYCIGDCFPISATQALNRN